MAWIEYTAVHLAERITGPEMSALKNAARGPGQNADALIAECITDVTQEIRGYVAAAKRNNTLGPVGTIPDELKKSAAALVVYQFITRLPNMKSLLDAQRTQNYSDAIERLKAVAAGEFVVVSPESPAPDVAQASGIATDLVSRRRRKARPSQTDGLL